MNDEIETCVVHYEKKKNTMNTHTLVGLHYKYCTNKSQPTSVRKSYFVQIVLPLNSRVNDNIVNYVRRIFIRYLFRCEYGIFFLDQKGFRSVALILIIAGFRHQWTTDRGKKPNRVTRYPSIFIDANFGKFMYMFIPPENTVHHILNNRLRSIPTPMIM